MSSRIGYGMLARQIEFGETPDYQQCLYYPDDEKAVLEDSWMKGSTYSAFACAVLQVIACAVLSTVCCCAYNRVTFERWLMWTYIYASCFMALTFLMFGAHFCKENDCDMANGGGMAISAWMFLVCCANMVKNMGQPPPDDMVDPDDDEDNLWYDDDADRFPQRYADDDEFEEYGYEEEGSYNEEDEFAYDDQYADQGVEMQDTDFLDPNKGGMVAYDPDDPNNAQPNNNNPDGGGMVAYDPNDPNAQHSQPPPQGDGGMVPHADPHDPYAQPPPPPPDGDGMVAYGDPNDPYAQQEQPQVGDRDGPELI